MFTRQVTYLDFNDKPHTEELYFHMMTPEMADLEFSTAFDGSLGEYIKGAMQSGEGAKIYTFFKMLVVNAYGRRTADGSEFVKDAAITEKFLNSRAWEQLFLWLTDDEKNAEAFWNGIFPKALMDKVEAVEASNSSGKRIQDMSKEELVELMQKKMQERKVIEG